MTAIMRSTGNIMVGVMGSARDLLVEGDKGQLSTMAEHLGAAIAKRGFVLLTGATTGLPDIVSRAAGAHGGLTIGISPAANREEHVTEWGLPPDGAQVIIYTGFGLKGRNVINIRASDIVIIFGGGMGTLNEFTIAYDEGKVIGVMRGSGGVADHIDAIMDFAGKPAMRCKVLFDEDPESLIESCVEALGSDRYSDLPPQGFAGFGVLQ
jgi:uncharacterized protein (TIGR00725 family)